ncbi:MAG: amino acid ABC transporter ATP-binding protein [Pirellulales bacterium]|nr:amino acid ABC transporter ATP-binding protein [Pirellulales bacterium]
MITVTDLHKRHGHLHVLKGIDLSVRAGEVAAIIGPSGGGKSTFLRCLNGLETFDQGSVRIGERQLLPGSHSASTQPTLLGIRRTVGMVFQQFNLFPHMNVLENVAAAPQMVLGDEREAALQRGRDLLARVGLADKCHNRPEQLSGGQQQRVAIARALAMRPEAILFDEPTSALDPRMTGEVLAVMQDLAQEGQTMIVVTHAMNFARRVAGTVHVFAEGKVLESGTPDQIFEHPTQAGTAAFVRELAD